MKDSRTESVKILHSFVTFAVIIISVTLIAMGVFAAKNNTAMIDDGISPAMIYARRENRQISVRIGESLYENEEKKEIPLTEIGNFAPAPINGIYIIYRNASQLINEQRQPQ